VTSAGGLRVIGAGLPRTGTNSLRLALTRLLGGSCHHMFSVKDDPAQARDWVRAFDGDLSGVQARLAGCVATVDWPSACFWRDLLAAHPAAVVVLSVRSSPDVWWRSFEATVLERKRHPEVLPGDDGSFAVMRDLLLERTFGSSLTSPAGAMAGYSRHNAQVRAQCPADRLLTWEPADGWGPLCAALGVPEPDEAFPRTNSTGEFHVRGSATGGVTPGPAAGENAVGDGQAAHVGA
jgi:Sulfotransferase domain